MAISFYSPVLHDHGRSDQEVRPEPLFKMIKEDILRTYQAFDGSTVRRIVGCCRSPGMHAAAVFRFGQRLKRTNLASQIALSPLYLLLYRRMRSKWGIEIPRSADIGPGLYIGHFGGIFIAARARIGKNASISHQVTIGISGQGSSRGCPVIDDNVYIAPGAKIFGKIRIGNKVKIGANVVAHDDVPDDAIVVLSPGYKILACGKTEDGRS